jgi:hypothetical protein
MQFDYTDSQKEPASGDPYRMVCDAAEGAMSTPQRVDHGSGGRIRPLGTSRRYCGNRSVVQEVAEEKPMAELNALFS